MSEYNKQNSTAGRKRSGRGKTTGRSRRRQKPRETNILYLILSITVPITCCVLLFSEVHSLHQQLDSLTGQLTQLERTAQEQQQELQKWQETVAAMGQATREQKPESGNLVEVLPEDGMDVNLEADVVQDAVQEYAHSVYLTFDDGPSIYTDKILDILAKYDVKATFFVVGKEDDKAKERMQRIVEEGHTIALHSYSHKYQEIYASVDAFQEDFRKLQDYVYEATGVKSNIYRFPGGSSNKVSDLPIKDFIAFLDSQDVKYYDWNISSGDGSSVLLDKDTILTNITKKIPDKKTAMVLMHDSGDKPTTVEALPAVIEKILAMEDTVILPITEATRPIQQIKVEE